MAKTKWVPEYPDRGCYAPQDYVDNSNTMTLDITKAMMFDTVEQCELWIRRHPYPVYVPAEHIFHDDKFLMEVMDGRQDH